MKTMLRWTAIIICAGAVLLPISCARGNKMEPSDIDAYLRGLDQNGYRFERQVDKNSWIIAFQGPAMKQAWSVAVAITGSGEKGRFISVGTTVWRGAKEPSREMALFLLEMNAIDNNVGSLSVFRSGKENFVQFFTKSPLAHYGKERLLFDIGFVGGFADSIQAKIAEAAR